MTPARPRGRIRRRRFFPWFLIFGLAAVGAVGVAIAGKPWTPLAGPAAIEITAIPIDFDRDDPSRKEFGPLRFRGGLALYADSHHFGGYSALCLDPDGKRLMALSDAGTWLRADLDHDGRFLKGLSRAVIGPLLGADGKPLAEVSRRDAEALVLTGGTLEKGDALVAFEVQHRIERYTFDKLRFGPPIGEVALPDPSLMGNAGIEALAIMEAGPSKGSLLAFSQERRDGTNALQGWLIGGANPRPLSLMDIGNYTITDLTVLPDGDVVVLERRFNFTDGLHVRLRRLAAKEIRPGATLGGEILLQSQGNLNLDNMEAIASHRASDGQTILTLMSDDNFSRLQRTLILQFALKDKTGR